MGILDNLFGGASNNPFREFSAGAGNEYSQEAIADDASQSAMADMQKYVDKNGGNISRGIVEYAGSPEGMKLQRIPGAMKKALDQYQKAMTPLPMQAAGVPSNQTGAYQLPGQTPTNVQAEPNIQNAPVGSQPYVTRPGVGGPGSAQPAPLNPQQPNVTPIPPGYGSAVTSQGQPGVQAGPSNQTAEIQNFEHFAQGLDPQMLDLMKHYKAGGPEGQRIALANQLLKSGLPRPLVDNVIMGNIQVTQDKDRPAIWYWQDTIHDPGNIHPFIPMIPGVGGKGLPQSAAPSWTNGLNPPASKDISSSPGYQPGVGGPAQPGPGGVGQLNAQQAHTLAAKYGVYDDAIGPDGKIRAVNRAWGPQGGLALGGGLAALIQNTTGHISRFFDPSQMNESAQAVSDAEQGLAALKYLLTGLGATTGGRTLKDMVDSAEELSPEHNKWDDPQYSIMQFQKMRSLLSMERDRTNEETSSMMINDPKNAESIRANNSKVWAIAKVLNWLPSDETLKNELGALRDGKLANVPSAATAGETIGQVAKTTVAHGAKAVGVLSNKADDLNADPEGTIRKMDKIPLKQLQRDVAPMWSELSPNIQDYLTKRAQAASKRGQAPQPGQAPQYAPGQGKPQGPSVQQFTQNPTGSFQGKPVKNLKTRNANNPLNPDLDQGEELGGFNRRFQGASQNPFQ